MRIHTIKSNHRLRLVTVMLFLLPFFSALRPVISRIFHIHIFIIMYMPILIIAVASIIWHHNIKANSRFLLLLVYYIIMLPVSYDIETGIISIMNLILAMSISSGLSKEAISCKYGLAFVIGIIVCNTLLLPTIVTKFGFNLTYMSTYRIPSIEGDINVGPNGWGQYLTLAVMLMLLIMYKKRHLNLLYLAIFGLLFIFIYLTQSRAQMLSAAVVTLFSMLVVFEKNNQSSLTKLAIAVTVLVAILALIAMINTGTTRYSDMEDISSMGKRTYIWRDAFFTFYSSNPLQWIFGSGTGGTGVYIAKVTNSIEDHVSAHSMYIDSLIMSGMVGTILLAWYWIETFVLLFRRRKKTIAFIFPLWVLFLGITTHFFANWPYMFALTVSEMALNEFTSGSNEEANYHARKLYSIKVY